MDWTKDAKSHYKKMAGLIALARQTAVESLMNHEVESQKRYQAEGAFVRRTLWGAKEDEQDGEQDEMRQTIVGDVTNPTPVIIQPPPQQSNTLGTIAAIVAAMATGGILGPTVLSALKPTAPVAQPMQQPQSYTDSTISVGLGKLENYEGLKP